MSVVLRLFLLAALAGLLSCFPAAAQTDPSLEAMAGQMIVVGFQGDEADDPAVQALAAEIKAGRLGGVMFLKTNVKSLDDVAAMNGAFRAAAPSPDLPPFITLDQEGGAVERLTKAVGFTEVPNAKAVAAANTPAKAEALYADMARRIAAVGFTVNFGPVADVDRNPNNQIIAKFGRAFSDDAATVAAYDAAFVKAHHQAGLLTALKHFPGHGSSTADSHEGFVDITTTWSDTELDPYRTLIGQDLADMVMVGHLYHADYDPDKTQLPASLSPQWIGKVLRGELHYKGVVISDDLEMGAIREHYDLKQTVLGAVRAGMDVLLFSNTADYHPGLAREILQILLEEAAVDPTFATRIEQSYARIVSLKSRIR